MRILVGCRDKGGLLHLVVWCALTLLVLLPHQGSANIQPTDHIEPAQHTEHTDHEGYAKHTPHTGHAAVVHEVRIGVLAKRGRQRTLNQWGPTADYLNAQIPQHHFTIVPLDFDAIIPAVQRQQIDFILANSSIYVDLEMRFGVNRIATMKNQIAGMAHTQFGGVIFTRADNHAINRLADLKGKRLMAVDATSLGGYQMAWYELSKANIDPDSDLQELSFAGTHDAVVQAVKEGRADVGTVRTDTLERMAQEGLIQLSDFKLLNAQHFSDYPFMISTPLYPEWPFASVPVVYGTQEKQLHEAIGKGLADLVAAALLAMPPDSAAAKAGHNLGWTVPYNYQPVHELMRQLKIGPYAQSGAITFAALYQQYQSWIIALSTLVVTMLLATLLIARINSRLRHVSAALEDSNTNLEHRVDERTQALNSALGELDHLHHAQSLLLDHVSEGIFGMDIEGRTTFLNPAAERMLGFNLSDMTGVIIHGLIHHSHADGSAYPAGACPMYRAIRELSTVHVDNEVLWRKDGSSFAVEYTSTPIIEQGQVVGAVIYFRDISERLQRDQQLRLAAIALETSEAIVITDAEVRIVQVNSAFTKVTGYAAEEVLGKNPRLLGSARHSQTFYQQMWQQIEETGSWEGELWNRHKSGTIYPEWLTITAVRDGNGHLTHYVGSFFDITERKQSEDRIAHQAYYDPLTDLPNRRLLLERLEQAVLRSKRFERVGVLLFMDLDNFKKINDSLGHPVGDKLLLEVATRIKLYLRHVDTAARLGGDEFVLLLPEISTSVDAAVDHAKKVAEKLILALAREFVIEEHRLHISVSIGIALFPLFSESPDDLLKFADVAMYQAKDHGKDTYRFYVPEMHEEATARLQLERDLRSAVEQEQFELHYQPQYDADAHIIGAEVLVRWHHYDRGWISPAEFIPVAEESGLIIPLGIWVLRTACQQIRLLQDQGVRPVRIAVNISPREFRRPDFVERVTGIIESTGASPELLELELTEGLLIVDVEDATFKILALQQLGLRFAIDDFGTGYSSLAYLKRLPLDVLKVDQSFVRDIETDPNDTSIVATIIAMATHLGFDVEAEGVETQGQLDFLKSQGCHIFQGYLFSRPIPFAQFIEKLL